MPCGRIQAPVDISPTGFLITGFKWLPEKIGFLISPVVRRPLTGPGSTSGAQEESAGEQIEVRVGKTTGGSESARLRPLKRTGGWLGSEPARR